MCEKCDKLQEQLNHEQEKPRITTTTWWVGIAVTIIIFVLTQVFIYGKVVGTVEAHIKNDLTTEQLNETFIRKDALEPRLNSIEKMLEYLYKREGGKIE